MSGTIIHLHGFLSTGVSDKSNQIKAAFPDTKVLSPDLYFNPQQIIETVDQLIRGLSVEDYPIVFVGTSLGGFWSNYFAQKYDCSCVIVNPCVDPSVTFIGRTGEYKKYTVDEMVTVTDADLEQYAVLKSQSDSIYNGYLVNLFLAKDDELIPYTDTLDVLKHTRSTVITQTGGHRFVDEWNQVIDKLKTLVSE